MDGKVQALDVANEGRIVWQSDLDGAALLGGNLGNMEVRTKIKNYTWIHLLRPHTFQDNETMRQ